MKDKSLPASIALAITVLAVAAAMVEAAKGMEEKESRDLPFSRLHGPDGLLSKLAKMNVTKDQKDMGIWNIIDSDQKHDRIVGGQQASAGQFKFFASLWVVISTTTVQFNSLNYGQGVEIRARRIDLHPQWDPYTMNNDFAVIELESDAVAADIQIVTLDDGSVNRVGQMATAIGFGYTSEGGYPPDVLRYVDIPVLANADCTNSTSAIGVSMLNSMLCAGSSGKDTCQGDSGGPLVIRNSLVQVGITSFGLGCARPTYPGAVYSRVSAGKAWIDTIKSRASPTPLPPTPTLTPGIADTCAAPKTVTCGQTIYASMASATSNDPDSLTDGFVDQWYLFSGNNREVTVSTCSSLTNFDTVLEVFTGQCGQLNSVAYNDDNYCEEGSSLASTTFFGAYRGTQYRIRVRPFSDTDAAYRYSLTIQCGPAIATATPTPTPGPPTPTLTPGIADTCAAPKTVTCGQTIYASMASATSNDPDSLTDGFVDQWYLFSGNNREVTVSTCSSLTNFDTVLEVFTGQCGQLNSVAYNNDDYCEEGSSLASTTFFGAYRGTQYRIRVSPFGDTDAAYRYSLTIQCGPAIATATPTPTPGPPTPTLTPGIADTCAAPKTVTCGQTIYASMASATSNDPDSLTDGFVDQWYLFSGNNHEVTVSTCSSLTNFDTVLEVFTGQCGQLNAVAYNDDNYCEEGSSLASTTFFGAYWGTQYRIRVRPFSDTDTTYRYSLTIQCDPMVTTTSPSPTRSRTPVPTRSRTPVPTRSRTPVPTRSRTPVPTRSRTPVPTRSRTPVPTRSRTPVPTRSRTPVPTRSRTPVPTWSRTPVPTRSRTPTPTRTRSPSPAPYANDVCASPRALSCGSTITASLRNATSTDPDSLNDGYADMWYSITGQGRAITLSTCHNATSFDTYLEAFTGACSSLSRAAQNDDTALSCNTNIGKITSLLTWTAQTNTLYRVRVRGYNGAKGNYGLITTCA